jgi:hypothetical protein
VKDELTIQPDGSGTVRLETVSLLPQEASWSRGAGGGALYPPVSSGGASLFFPGKEFAIKTVRNDQGATGSVLVLEVAFKNLDALLASPYGHAHALSVKRENGILSVRASSGLAIPAQLAAADPKDFEQAMEVPGLADLGKRKQELRGEFRLTLPNAATAANGAREGKTVTWVFERAKTTNDTEFIDQAARVLEAACGDDGLTFAPDSPVRLGLQSFAQLAAGTAKAPKNVPNERSVAAAARFVPCSLQVTRTVNLSGQDSSSESGAELAGLVVLPAELAPMRWGEPKLEEAVDPKGVSLKPDEDSDNARHFGRRFGSFVDGEEETDETAVRETSHSVSLQFKAPDWKTKEIARVKGSIDILYPGTFHVIKFTNAIPASAIEKAGEAGSDIAVEEGQRAVKLTDPKLAELGLELRVQTVMKYGPATMLALGSEGDASTLMDAQVFDATGKPCPCLMPAFESGHGTIDQLVVPGRPPGPWSIAVLVAGPGPKVTVPILVEHVPVGGK